MYALSYLINNSFCLLIMAIIFVCHLRGPDTRQSTGLFRAMVIGMMAFTVLDMLCGLQENGAIRPTRWCVEVLNVLYFSVSAATVFVACLYTENELGATWLGNRKKIGLLALPLLVLVVCLPLTLQYGFFFYISSDGRYIKGPAYVLMALMSYGYFLVIGVKALAGMFRKSNFARRHAYSAVASFVVCPLIAGLIQSFHTGLSILCMGCTVALVQVFINIQQSRITIDPLTQINNRSRLLQHLDKALARQKGSPERQLYLFMIDIDDFKQINDRYGHLEGDRALICLADALKDAAAECKCLIARFGGDEFAVAMEPKSEEEVTRFQEELRRFLAMHNAAMETPYTIHISIGCTRCTPEHTSIPALIQAADKALYQAKAAGKQSRANLH